MSRVLLDTNVLISFLTDRNAGQQARAGELFEGAAQGEHELLVHQVVGVELVYVLKNLYAQPASDIACLVRDLLAMPGVLPVEEVAWFHVLDLWPDRFPDFADAVLASTLQQGRYDAVATFDEAFRKCLRRAGLAVYR